MEPWGIFVSQLYRRAVPVLGACLALTGCGGHKSLSASERLHVESLTARLANYCPSAADPVQAALDVDALVHAYARADPNTQAAIEATGEWLRSCDPSDALRIIRVAA